MQQTVIKVGNSLAVTIPKAFVDEVELKAGEKINVVVDSAVPSIVMQRKNFLAQDSGITPEFLKWVNDFTAKHKKALSELAHK